MIKEINIGNYESAIKVLTVIKENDYVPFDIRITNSHLTRLNKVIGFKLFRKDALYVNSRTLWEIMQPLGGKGKHHYHNLYPDEIFDILLNFNKSNLIIPTHDSRFLVVVISSKCQTKVKYAVIIEPNGTLSGTKGVNVTRIITIYPYNKK